MISYTTEGFVKVNSAWWTSGWICFTLSKQQKSFIVCHRAFWRTASRLSVPTSIRAASPIRCVSLHVTLLLPSAHFYLSDSCTAFSEVQNQVLWQPQSQNNSSQANNPVLPLCHSVSFVIPDFFLPLCSIYLFCRDFSVLMTPRNCTKTFPKMQLLCKENKRKLEIHLHIWGC